MRGKSRSTKAAIEEAVTRVLEGGEPVEQVAAATAVHVLTIRKYLAARKAAAGGPSAASPAMAQSLTAGAGMGPIMGPADSLVGASPSTSAVKRGRKPVLDQASELELLEHVLQLHAQGASLSSEQVLQMANDRAAALHGDTPARQQLTVSWLRRFKERHPQLPLAYIPASLAPADGVVGLDDTGSSVNVSTGASPAPSAGGGDPMSKRGRKPILDARAEQEIMEAIQALERQGQRVTSDTILQLARDKVRELSGNANAPLLSMSWLQRFKERHPTLFSERVRLKRGRDDDDLDAHGALAQAGGPHKLPRAPRANGDGLASVQAAGANASAASAANSGRFPIAPALLAANGSLAAAGLFPTTQRAEELLEALVRATDKVVDMQNRQLEVLLQLVDAVKEKQV